MPQQPDATGPRHMQHAVTAKIVFSTQTTTVYYCNQPQIAMLLPHVVRRLPCRYLYCTLAEAQAIQAPPVPTCRDTGQSQFHRPLRAADLNKHLQSIYRAGGSIADAVADFHLLQHSARCLRTFAKGYRELPEAWFAATAARLCADGYQFGPITRSFLRGPSRTKERRWSEAWDNFGDLVVAQVGVYVPLTPYHSHMTRRCTLRWCMPWTTPCSPPPTAAGSRAAPTRRCTTSSPPLATACDGWCAGDGTGAGTPSHCRRCGRLQGGTWRTTRGAWRWSTPRCRCRSTMRARVGRWRSRWSRACPVRGCVLAIATLQYHSEQPHLRAGSQHALPPR